MKLDTRTGCSDLTSREVVTSAYRIQENAKMFDILSSRLYTDKILAPIRELLCNAYDAHVAAGIPDRPIEVTITDNFSVRDFGTGLSVEDMTELYTTYGASNKADSNNFIGCLGLGSKSPFAYTSMFTVISRHKGMVHKFVCSMSDHVPSIHRFPSEKLSSGESTGLEVSFALDRDSRQFRDKLEWFALYFCAPIKLNTRSEIVVLHRQSVDFGGYGVYFNGSTGCYGNNTVQVLMGGVLYAYTLPTSHSAASPLTYEQFDVVRNAVRSVRADSFIIKAQMGDVDIAASRELCEQRPRTENFVLTKLFN